MAQKSPVNTRWEFLDSIRGIAAIAVVFQHILWFVSPAFSNFFGSIWSPGRFGVVAFFIVSGFIVPRSLELKKNIPAFWRSRFFRLYPAYWASLAAIGLVLALNWTPHPLVQRASTVDWIVNLTMLQEFVRIKDINPVAWTLGLEVLLYASITAGFKFGILKKTWVISAFLLGILALGSIVLPGLFHIRFPAGAAAVGTSIVLGLVLYRWFAGELSKNSAILLALCCFAVNVVSSLINYHPTISAADPLQPTQLCAIASVAVGYLFFVAILHFKDSRFPKWTLWLGKVSYSLYLLHPVAGMLVPDSIYVWIRVILVLLLSCFLAWGGYELIEKPSMRWAKGRTV